MYIQQLKLHVIHEMEMILWSFLFCVVEYCSRCYVSFVCPFGLCLLMRMPFRFVSMSSVGNINLFFVSPWKTTRQTESNKNLCTVYTPVHVFHCYGWKCVQFLVFSFAVLTELRRQFSLCNFVCVISLLLQILNEHV